VHRIEKKSYSQTCIHFIKSASLKNMTDLFVYSYYSKTFPIYKIHMGVLYKNRCRFHVKLKTCLSSIQKNDVFIFI